MRSESSALTILASGSGREATQMFHTVTCLIVVTLYSKGAVQPVNQRWVTEQHWHSLQTCSTRVPGGRGPSLAGFEKRRRKDVDTIKTRCRFSASSATNRKTLSCSDEVPQKGRTGTTYTCVAGLPESSQGIRSLVQQTRARTQWEVGVFFAQFG